MTDLKCSRVISRRNGFSLVECLATLSVLLVLGMASASLLSSVTEIGLQANHNKMARSMIERLALAIRFDVSIADSIEVTNEGKRLKIMQNDMIVEFVVIDEPISIRRESANTKDKKASVTNEQFVLTNRCVPVFSESDTFVQLRLTHDGQPNPWIIEAAKR